jgi:peptidyl-Asp metalloendopeptidase
MVIRILSRILLVSLFANLATQTSAQGLFTPSAAKAGPIDGDTSVGVVRSRSAQINFNYLNDQMSSGSKATDGSSNLTLNLFDDKSAAIQVWETNVAGSEVEKVLSGWSPGSENSLATIVINEGEISGKFWMENRLYRFRPQPGQGYVISEIDTSAFEVDDDTPEDIGGSAKLTSTKRAAKNEAIDLLVLFTIKASTQVSKVKNTATLWVAEMNEVLRRSGSATDNMFNLVGVKVVDVEVNKPNTDVYRLAGKDDGYLDGVHKLRDQLGADLVSLVYWPIKQNLCGKANGIGPKPGSDTGTPNVAFNVVFLGCAGDYLSFAHEIGHTVGARHDHWVDNDKNYNHGLSWPQAGWRTVMAYNDRCDNFGVKCSRLPFFSNPNVQHNGKKTGRKTDHKFPAYNAKLFRENRSLIAAYRSKSAVSTFMTCPVPAGAGPAAGKYAGKPYWKVAIPGLFYGGTRTSTPRECHDACAKDANCTSWTWINFNSSCSFMSYCPSKANPPGFEHFSGYSGRKSICTEATPRCNLKYDGTAGSPPHPAGTQPNRLPSTPTPAQGSGWQSIN